jgi:hypothetical protein
MAVNALGERKRPEKSTDHGDGGRCAPDRHPGQSVMTLTPRNAEKRQDAESAQAQGAGFIAHALQSEAIAASYLMGMIASENRPPLFRIMF